MGNGRTDIQQAFTFHSSFVCTQHLGSGLLRPLVQYVKNILAHAKPITLLVKVFVLYQSLVVFLILCMLKGVAHAKGLKVNQPLEELMLATPP